MSDPINIPTAPVPPSRRNPQLSLLYGPPKGGKTTIAALLPDSLILELEPAGADFVTARKIDIRDMAHLQAVAHGRMLIPEQPCARPSPSGLAAMLNRDLYGRFGDNRYATMFYGEYHLSTRVLRYVNAGSCPPILISAAGEVTVLRDGDLPIGLFPEMTYQELGITLSRGSAMVVYSDGLIDALNLQGSEFGEERLVRWCKRLPKGASAESICTFLSQRVAEWSAGAEQFDDTTLLVLAVE